MKIAITAHADNKCATVDSRFGRADYFVIYDQESDTWDSLANKQNHEAAHGAGIQAGQNLAQTGAKVLITGHVGPKAFKVLQAEQIAMYSFSNDISGTVEEVLSAFQAGKLTAIAAPNALDIKK